ncbi:hypothetical protein O1M63_48745 [Streptomyces mirabilis]|nr:hypothetical protein [Streptomyces mirabilis]
MRTLDLVQTGLDATGAVVLVDALLTATENGRRIERLFVGGNPLGAAGAVPLSALVAEGAVDELYVSAAGLGDAGRCVSPTRWRGHRTDGSPGSPSPATASGRAPPPGWWRRRPRRGHPLDLGRVRAAAVLGAADNRLDLTAATDIAHTSRAPNTASPTSSSRTPACAAARPTVSSTPPRAPRPRPGSCWGSPSRPV